jgi:hypothetical protein
MSEDPIDFDGGTNFYDYAANDPITLIDPWGLWHCAAGVNCNFTPDMKRALDCFDKCTGQDSTITSGRRPPSPKHPNSSHSRGEACDLNRADNPSLPPDKAKRCFLQCFVKGFGQQERNSPGYNPQGPERPRNALPFTTIYGAWRTAGFCAGDCTIQSLVAREK